MNPDSQSYTVVDTPADARPTTDRTVEDMLASCTMRGAISIPRDMRRGVAALCIVLTVTLLLVSVLVIFGGATMWAPRPIDTTAPAPETEGSEGETTPPEATYPYADGKAGSLIFPTAANAQSIDASIIGSSHAVVVSVKEGKAVATLSADESIFPASMTKVMTLIVAVENLPRESSLSDTVTISQEVCDRMAAEGSSGFGFKPGSKLTVEALLYALMLKSDGIAACELARYVAGSEEAFVNLMNEKAAAMGLSGTHFENPTGLHHPKHKSTVRNIASIMAYAMDMQLCRRILTAEVYKTSCVMADGETIPYTFYHNLLVTQFEKNSSNHPSGLKIIAGKTGYTDESGYCLVTYAQGTDGNDYIAVTTEIPKTAKYAGCIADYIALYNAYAKS